MASVGVWTRPTDATFPAREPNIRLVMARVPLIPMSQSLSLRDCAASARPRISLCSRRWPKASRIDWAVIDCSQRRLTGGLFFARRQRLLKMSSPSRPASQALMSCVMSLRAMSFFRRPKTSFDLSIGLSSNSSGMIGSVSSRQKPYFFLSMSSGISSSATCPTAEEMTYSSFSKWSPFLGTLPRARARSAATLGFSAMMSDLDISNWGTVPAKRPGPQASLFIIEAGRVEETTLVSKLDLGRTDYASDTIPEFFEPVQGGVDGGGL